eukprot:s829_g21.t1
MQETAAGCHGCPWWMVWYCAIFTGREAEKDAAVEILKMGLPSNKLCIMSRDVALEVSWCRRLVQGVEKDYEEMVNSLLAENKQLEELLNLMARHLDNLAANFQGRDLEGPEAAQAACEATARLSARLEEWQRQAVHAREFQQEKVLLQKRLCEERERTNILEEMSNQDLRRQLEALQEATVTSPELFESSEIDEEMGKAALISRLQAAEEARLQELGE